MSGPGRRKPSLPNSMRERDQMRSFKRQSREARGRPIVKKALIAIGAVSLTLPLVSQAAMAGTPKYQISKIIHTPKPHETGVDTSRGLWYVSNELQGSGGLSVYQIGSDKLLGKVSVEEPTCIPVVQPNGELLPTTAPGYCDPTGSEGHPRHPHGLAFSTLQSNGHYYVYLVDEHSGLMWNADRTAFGPATTTDQESSLVVEIDVTNPAQPSIVRGWVGGHANEEVAYDANNGKVYVANHEPSSSITDTALQSFVSVIDPSVGRAEATTAETTTDTGTEATTGTTTEATESTALAVSAPEFEPTAGTPLAVALEATGGTAPYTWTLSSGAVPSGMTFDAAKGIIWGTPTTAGEAYSFTVTATDSASPAATATSAVVSGTVGTAEPPASATLAIATESLEFAQDTPMATMLEATGGTAPYTWKLDTGSILPTGITFDATNGLFYGTPTVFGEFYSISITVTDSASPAATANIVYSGWVNSTELPEGAGEGTTTGGYEFVNLPYGDDTQGIAYLPSTHQIITNSAFAGLLYVINDGDNAVARTVDILHPFLAARPDIAAALPDQTNPLKATLTVHMHDLALDPLTGNVFIAPHTLEEPHAVAENEDLANPLPEDNLGWIGGPNHPQGALVEVSLFNGDVVRTLSVPGVHSHFLAVDPVRGIVWDTGEHTGNVAAINEATGAVIQTFHVPGANYLGDEEPEVHGVSVDVNTGTAYVADETEWNQTVTLFTVVPPPVKHLGYWAAASDGGVFAFGDAPFYGSLGNVHLNQPVVGMAATPDNRGYWMVASDGGVFAFGKAAFYGSLGNIKLAQPVVGMASTPSGHGYWLVAKDGGVFAFGDAKFFGSTGNIRLNQPVVGMASAPNGSGYWLVAKDGGVFAFGKAAFYGSTGNIQLNQPMVGMFAKSNGSGYWMVAKDGGVFAFGKSGFFGSTGNIKLDQPVVGMHATANDSGYWLVASDGGIFAFGNAGFAGSTGGIPLNAPVVGMDSHQ